ncbi:helix-turn-helix domain-containing protein [Altererythrobacter sp. FM1]|uniref:Helix-turn-helix domain-containing protein n=1 Tax=Tsuneonella flava TaxID=2055955 RepID=A0ABX7KB85_9SPHN|nr:helix-turn-helix domain-containing protein [Tsuneonella flava]QSB45534.1 helix-turn-helix domain-containing protein [Tsuneonella flava]ROT97127.1 helix-turn-helix domain-containing protein [Altererythrobacter sp. FM1]
MQSKTVQTETQSTAALQRLLSGIDEMLGVASEMATASGKSWLAEQIEDTQFMFSRSIARESEVIDTLPASGTLAIPSQDPGQQTVNITPQMVVGDNMDAVVRTYLVASIQRKLRTAGPACAKLLVLLMSEADSYVASSVVRAHLRTNSHDDRVIKVYICRLRSELRLVGIRDAIVTGRKSYMFRKRYLAPMLTLLNEA